jgi:NADPH:quinone reductase
MRAVLVPEFGLDNVRAGDLEDPTPAAGEVLVRTEAATVNPADLGVVTGAAAGRFPPGITPPYTPGWDLVGRVIAVGDGVDGGLVGSRVIGFSLWFVSGRGTQASVVSLPASDVVLADGALPSAQLTTVGLNGLTAWWGLAGLGLRQAETLVVTGGAGGVGGFAVELATHRGLEVVAVVRAEDRENALALGARNAVAADAGELGAAVRNVLPGGADAMLDTASIGGPALGALRDGGRYVTVTDVPDAERGIHVSRAFGKMDREGLTTLVAMAGKGELHTPVADIFGVDDAGSAYRTFTQRRGRGRIVLAFS